MKQNDSILLLKECDAGLKNATSSMEQVMHHLEEGKLRRTIEEYNQEHIAIGKECSRLLEENGRKERRPRPVVKAMSQMSTAIRLRLSDTPETVAALMHKGCQIGIRSLSHYLNQYPAADGSSRQLAEDVIKMEDSFERDLRPYL